MATSEGYESIATTTEEMMFNVTEDAYNSTNSFTTDETTTYVTTGMTSVRFRVSFCKRFMKLNWSRDLVSDIYADDQAIRKWANLRIPAWFQRIVGQLGMLGRAPVAWQAFTTNRRVKNQTTYIIALLSVMSYDRQTKRVLSFVFEFLAMRCISNWHSQNNYFWSFSKFSFFFSLNSIAYATCKSLSNQFVARSPFLLLLINLYLS